MTTTLHDIEDISNYRVHPPPPLPSFVARAPQGGGSTGWRSALATLPPTGEADSEKIARARPHLALSSNGRRSGFGTGPTGARVTIGGALLVEQV